MTALDTLWPLGGKRLRLLPTPVLVHADRSFDRLFHEDWVLRFDRLDAGAAMLECIGFGYRMPLDASWIRDWSIDGYLELDCRIAIGPGGFSMIRFRDVGRDKPDSGIRYPRRKTV